ncbi:MAG: hypothetical protein AB1600_00635 [Bacteroidota bacterium]
MKNHSSYRIGRVLLLVLILCGGVVIGAHSNQAVEMRQSSALAFYHDQHSAPSFSRETLFHYLSRIDGFSFGNVKTFAVQVQTPMVYVRPTSSPLHTSRCRYTRYLPRDPTL